MKKLKKEELNRIMKKLYNKGYNSNYRIEFIRKKEKMNDYSREYNVDLAERKVNKGFIPECKIGNISDNYWFRTKKGIDAEEYKSFNLMKNAILKTARNKGIIFKKLKVYKINEELKSYEEGYKTIIHEEEF